MTKAQATGFFIIALLIVSLVVTIYFVKDTVFFERLRGETEKAITIPEFAKEVEAFTESCIRNSLIGGADILGAQGGYITLPLDPYPISPFNLFSNSLDLFGEGKALIPYWFYETVNGIEKIQMPTLKSMEDQLAQYTKLELPQCLSDFENYRKKGYSINYGIVIPKIIINKDEIIATINFPIKIKFQNQEFNIERFKVSVEKNLGRLYDLAKEIYLKENINFFIENYVLDSMVVYSDKIPYSGIDFECSPKTWTKQEVINDLKNVLMINIPQIKIKGSNIGLNQDFDKYFLIDTTNAYKDVTVNFIFSDNWPFLIDILGEDSEIIRGKPFTTENALNRFLTHIFCLNQYHFVYDLKFPVLITFYDEKTNDLFQFATQVIIDNNQPRENRADPATLDLDSPICKYPNNEMKIFALGIKPDDSMEPLDNVRISFKCLTAVCDIGYTKKENNDLLLTANFPRCFNGQLIAEKDGYHRSTEFISTTREATTSIVLEPIYELDLKTMVIDNGNIRPIQPTEQAVFTFENKEKDYVTTATYPGTDKVRLIAGSYDVKSYLIVTSDSGISIPESEIKTCFDAPKEGLLGALGLKEKKCKKQKIEGINLNQIYAGGASFTWDIDRRILSNSKKLTLYTLRFEIPKSVDELTNIDDKILKNSNNIKLPDLE